MRDRTTRDSSCRERERERGLALVEFALVVPFLLILIVGIIDFGFLFNDVISVRQGARDGGRQAAVGKFGSDSTCWLDLSAPGSTSPSARMLMCLTKSRDNVPDEKTRVRLIVGDGSQGDAYRVGQPIAICEQFQMRSLTGMLPVLSGRVFKTQTVFRVETVAPGLVSGSGTVSVSENPLPNSDWASCAAPSSVS